MIPRNTNKVGRTFFDLVAEHPIKSYSLTGLIVLVIGGLILIGKSMQIGNVKVNANKEIIHDTILQPNSEKQYIDKPITIIKSMPYSNQPIRKIESKILPLTTIKIGDTIISTNYPSNINTGNNNGIIGNGNAVNVNVSEVQRILSLKTKNELLNIIKSEFAKRNKNKNCCIQIGSLMGNNECFNYATEIFEFLKSEKFNVNEDIGVFNRQPPVIGVLVGFENSRISQDTCFVISVGYRP